MDYIEQRETTFPTFLEMLMATYRLVQKSKETGYEELVNHLIDEEYLKKLLILEQIIKELDSFTLKLQCTLKIHLEF